MILGYSVAPSDDPNVFDPVTFFPGRVEEVIGEQAESTTNFQWPRNSQAADWFYRKIAGLLGHVEPPYLRISRSESLHGKNR